MTKLVKRNNKYLLLDYRPRQTVEMLLATGAEIEMHVEEVDKRFISDQQRKFIFALCGEMSNYRGKNKEIIRLEMMNLDSMIRGYDFKSLKEYTVTEANQLIDTIINLCIELDIPINGEIVRQNEYFFDEKQTYQMALKRECVVCGRLGSDIHHVDQIGTKGNRAKISHIGMRALPLCREHHSMCHNDGSEKFIKKYHLTPFVIDEKMEAFVKHKLLKEYKDEDK